MKKVHKADMVAHLWAHQSQAEARNPGGNFRFDGPVLYSYSTPIGMIHKAGKIALVCSDSFSHTTASQQRDARRAASHLAVFEVPFIGHAVSAGRGRTQPKNWRVLNRDYLLKQYTNEVKRLEASRRGPSCLAGAPGVAAEVRAVLTGSTDTLASYCAMFGLKVPATDSAADAARIVEKKGATWARHAYAENAQRERYRKKYEASRIAAIADAAETIAAWRRGEAVRLPYVATRDADGGAMLRYRPGDDPQVETSQGATVPTQDAIRAIAFVEKVRSRGAAWARNGEQFPVGQFQLDSVSVEGNVKAGCHLILWDEIVRLQAALTVAPGA